MGDYPRSRGLPLSEESKLSWMDEKEFSPLFSPLTINGSIKRSYELSDHCEFISPPFYPASTPRLIVDDDLLPSSKQGKFPMSMFRRRTSTSSTDTESSNQSVGLSFRQVLSQPAFASVVKQDVPVSPAANHPILKSKSASPKPGSPPIKHTVTQVTQTSEADLPPLNPHPRSVTNDRQHLYSTFTRSLDTAPQDKDTAAVKPLEGMIRPCDSANNLQMSDLISPLTVRVGQINGQGKREKSIFDSVIMVVETLVLTSAADTAGLRVGDWIVSIGRFNASNWHPDCIADVAAMVREWPRSHRGEKLKIEVLRRVKSQEVKALPRNAQVVQTRCLVANPQADSNDSDEESKWSMVTLNLQALTLNADISSWSMADVMSRDTGGVLGACLALFPEPARKPVRAQQPVKRLPVKAAPAQAKPSALPHKVVMLQPVKAFTKIVPIKNKRVVVESNADPNEAAWRRVSHHKNRRANGKATGERVQVFN